MFCRNCEAELPERTSKCPSCGNVTSSPLLSTPSTKRNCCLIGCSGMLALFLIMAVLAVYSSMRAMRAHQATTTHVTPIQQPALPEKDRGLDIAIQRWLFDHKQVKLKAKIFDIPNWAEGESQFVLTHYKDKDRALLFNIKGSEVVSIDEMGSNGRKCFWKKGSVPLH